MESRQRESKGGIMTNLLNKETLSIDMGEVRIQAPLHIKCKRTPQEQEIAHLKSIIRNYECDIRNAVDLFGIDLIKLGFCQGEIYKTALTH